MTTLIIFYLLLGIIIILIHPKLRSTIAEPLRQPSCRRGEAVLICCIVLFIAIPLWPIIWLTNSLAASSEKETLAEIKRHLVQKGRNITESDPVLLTYYGLILDRLNKVAKERGEKLPKAVIKEVSFSYMNFWVELNESRLGLGMPLLLKGGMETYREGGIQALLQLLREDQAHDRTQIAVAARDGLR